MGSVEKVVQGGIAQHIQKSSNTDSWLFAMTSEFRKTIITMDKNRAGRVLTAIAREICQSPTSPRGDIVKKLTGDLDGYWRYRFGDYRLIYLPDPATRTVYLVYFDARDDVYDKFEA